MKLKKNIYILLLLIMQISFSQEKVKKDYLYDEDWKKIEIDTFQDKIKNRKYIYKIIENDTAVIGKIYLKEKIGKITRKLRLELLKNLEIITNSKIDSLKTIVINYYSKPEVKQKGSCINNYTSDRKYKKYFKKNDSVIQFFITEKDFKYRKKTVYEDKNNFIQKKIFIDNFPCGNYIIIRANGDYLRRLGEYHQGKIPEKIKANWKNLQSN